jgi:hypothetical protein
MTPIRLARTKLLDGEMLFKYYWNDMGNARSVRKLTRYITSQGKVNPVSHKPFTDMAIWFSMWGWAIDNLKESYEIYNRICMDRGEFHTLAEWVDFLAEKLLTITKHDEKRVTAWRNQNQNA